MQNITVFNKCNTAAAVLHPLGWANLGLNFDWIFIQFLLYQTEAKFEAYSTKAWQWG